MFDYFRTLLINFPEHHFSSYWQNQQMASLKNSLARNRSLVIHDFSESYRCIEKVELQSTYFSRQEISVHVSVIHRPGQLEYDQVDESETIAEVFFTLSPDLGHDHYFVLTVQAEIKNYLDSIGCPIEIMTEFTDGCSAQYKSRF